MFVGGMQTMLAFIRSRRCWFSDIANEGTISEVCPFKLAARNLSSVKHMEYLETSREDDHINKVDFAKKQKVEDHRNDDSKKQ